MLRIKHLTTLTTLAALATLLLPGPARARSLADGAGVAPLSLSTRLSAPLLPAGQLGTAYLKVELAGAPLQLATRPPVNVALVIDKSGSMQGTKIERAREAAIQAIRKLGPQDIVSIVTYDTTVAVVAPATKASDQETLIRAIRGIHAGGDTALFAGVTKGAAEVRKFLERGRVNRVLLLSDGLANVGPSSPAELGALGASLVREGISVTTFGLGLGYNEDLMTELARQSDGNHAFIEDAANLAQFFDLELGTAVAVVAQDVQLRLDCGPGVRPVRVLGRPAEIIGQLVTTSMNQIYAAQRQHLLLEVEVSPGAQHERRQVAAVSVTYGDLKTRTSEMLSGEAAVTFTNDRAAAERATDRSVMVSAVELIANERNALAVSLRDRGEVQRAREVLRDNAAYLQSNSVQLDAPALEMLRKENESDAENLEGEGWNRQRKSMRKKQLKMDMQQMY
ncbi:VWA domain-containing protein [Myxococcota bacterium]|nr:VWA domain-containing protein [Myxococcota bacterium]